MKKKEREKYTWNAIVNLLMDSGGKFIRFKILNKRMKKKEDERDFHDE